MHVVPSQNGGSKCRGQFYPLHTTHTDSRDKNISSYSGVDSNSKLSQ